MLAVDTLLALLLLNLVNADEEVAALDVVDVELRQLLDVAEAAPDETADGRPPLRVL